MLNHRGRATHVCVNNVTIIGSDNGLSPGRCQATIRINDGILLTRTLGANFGEIVSEINTFSFKKIHLKCRLRNGGNFVSASMCCNRLMQGIGVDQVVSHWWPTQMTYICVSMCQYVVTHNHGDWHNGLFNVQPRSLFIIIVCLEYTRLIGDRLWPHDPPVFCWGLP